MGGYSFFSLRRSRELDLKELWWLLTRFDVLLHENDRSEWKWEPQFTIDEQWLVIQEAVGQSMHSDPILRTISAYTHDDAFYFSYCTTSETFTYNHWRDGNRVRTLERGGDGNDEFVWQVVEGEPDGWEREVFFKERSLRTALVDCKPEAAQAISSYWHVGLIVKGQIYPSFFGGVKSVCWAVTFHYQFPVYYYQAEHEKPSKL